MRRDRLVPGTILVIIGIVFLLDNFGVIDFNWWCFFSLWPILLIIGGVNLLFAHNRTHWATTIKVVVLLIGMGIIITSGLTTRPTGWLSWAYTDKDDYTFKNIPDEYKGTGTDSVVNFNNRTIYRKPFKVGTTQAQLNISGGVSTYAIKGTTSDLFQASTKQGNDMFNLDSHTDSLTQVLDFDMSGGNNSHHGFIFNTAVNRANIRLNTAPEWDIDVESGASKVNFDLTDFKIKKLTIQGGASSYRIKMGQPLANTGIEVQTGVSKVYISIPKNAACHITSDTGLSSRSFEGFDKKDDGVYETPGFDKATNKITISIDGGVSHFKVSRY